MHNGQVSVELIVIIGAILVIFIPLLLHVYFKTSESNQELSQIQAEIISSRLANTINSVGNLGENTSLISEIYIPQNVKAIELKNIGRGAEITVKISTLNGDTEIVDIAKFPVNSLIISNPLQGIRRFYISYDGKKVNVNLI